MLTLDSVLKMFGVNLNDSLPPRLKTRANSRHRREQTLNAESFKEARRRRSLLVNEFIFCEASSNLATSGRQASAQAATVLTLNKT